MTTTNQQIVPLKEYTPKNSIDWFKYAESEFEKTSNITEEIKFYSVIEMILPHLSNLSRDVKQKISFLNSSEEYQSGNYKKLKTVLNSGLTKSFNLNNTNLECVIANWGGGSLNVTGKVKMNVVASEQNLPDNGQRKIVGSILNDKSEINLGGEVDIKIQKN